MGNEKLLKKIASGRVYLVNTFEQCLIRSELGKGYFAKFAGKPEYPIDRETILVTETILKGREITEKEYNFKNYSRMK